jgi:K+ transporter
MITPAISVLSAVEGMNIVTPLFEPYVVPIASAILLHCLRSRATAAAKSVASSAR